MADLPVSNAPGQVILGYALVSTVDGIAYYDTEDTHISDEEMLRAATNYMLHSRRGLVNHIGKEAGEVLFSFPFTLELCAAFELSLPISGWAIGWRPYDEELIDRVRAGEFTGFSIGGRATHFEPSPHGSIVRGLEIEEVSLVDHPGQELALVVGTVALASLFTELPMLHALYSHAKWDGRTALPTAHIRIA